VTVLYPVLIGGAPESLSAHGVAHWRDSNTC